jgi:hypothetical protein
MKKKIEGGGGRRKVSFQKLFFQVKERLRGKEKLKNKIKK